MQVPSSVRPDVAPLWDFLRQYEFTVRWREPCSFTAELHGAVRGKFDEAGRNGGGRKRRNGGWQDPYKDVNVLVSGPRTAGDLQRIRSSVMEELQKSLRGIFVVIVTKWFN
ncbi:MAG TPA: hypothetical protein VJS68_02520, partial [Thermoplasmata archaeon]|nr:hypothetical protein [Thermoplasmata archaeon]